jgi:hypothetical protein
VSLGLSIDLRDTARPALNRLQGALRPEQLNPVIGRAVVNVYRGHLLRINRERPNQLGGKRTNFYAQAGRGTNFTVDPDGITVSIASVGIAQRFYGGVIRPKASKFLTIAVHPAAHGKRAREMDLEVVFGEAGRPIALATKSTRAVQLTQNKRGQLVRKMIGRRGEIMFLLKKSVTQNPDPTVLPRTDEVAGAAIIAVNDSVDRAIKRQGGAN